MCFARIFLYNKNNTYCLQEFTIKVRQVICDLLKKWDTQRDTESIPSVEWIANALNKLRVYMHWVIINTPFKCHTWLIKLIKCLISDQMQQTKLARVWVAFYLLLLRTNSIHYVYIYICRIRKFEFKLYLWMIPLLRNTFTL